jgi:hypothetical protein
MGGYRHGVPSSDLARTEVKTTKAEAAQWDAAATACGLTRSDLLRLLVREGIAAPRTRLTGMEAVAYADRNGRLLNRLGDSAGPASSGLSIEEATAIARVEPSLIWVEMIGLSSR